ncbi:hypothetical protein AB1Y20_003894 [Prymnesium parvum]|uniref:Uncharacterized protein n=1 Tax=Prymnesium parvum TaxID=97485 RepID=A0AB34J547_PRYPA
MRPHLALSLGLLSVEGVPLKPMTRHPLTTPITATPTQMVLHRRRLLLHAAQLVAGASLLPAAPAHASLSDKLREGEAALAQASDSPTASAALTQLLEVSSDYNGLPSDALREEVVNAMRAKRIELQRTGAWDGTSEESYNRLMRSVDPWRVVELQPVAQRTLFTFAPVYVAMLAVQQIAPKFFNAAYGVGAAVVLGPLFLQIVVG